MEDNEGQRIRKVENHDEISEYERSRNERIKEKQRILERIMKSNICTPVQKAHQKEGNLYADEKAQQDKGYIRSKNNCGVHNFIRLITLHNQGLN